MQLSQSICLKQKQSMVMTPRLQQAIRMLQMNNLDLASYLEDQALENPFLEVGADSDASGDVSPEVGSDVGIGDASSETGGADLIDTMFRRRTSYISMDRIR